MSDKTCFCIDRKEELEKEAADLQERLRKADEVVEAGIKYMGITKNGLHNTILHQDLFKAIQDYKESE